MASYTLNSLEDLDQLPGVLDPAQAEEAIKATLHLAGWRPNLEKVEVAGWLLAILAAVQPGPKALSIEIRRALMGWAAGSADPENFAFMDVWRRVIVQLDLDQAARQLLVDTGQRSQDQALLGLIDQALEELDAS
ncbi:MAG: hypothetical protein PVG63_07390 [Anaerolineales bacterium]|jgi:hypothetical protein